MPRPRSLVPILLVLAALSAGEVALFATSVTPRSAFLSGEPPLSVDYSLTTYLIEAGRRFHRTTGRLWGYDPYFGAGYPQAYLEDNFPLLQIIAVCLPSVPAGLILLCSNAFLLATLPWVLYGSIRAFGAGRAGSLVATLLGLTALRAGEFALFPIMGSVLAGFVQVWFLATFAALHAWLRRPSPGRLALLCVLVSFSLMLHKSAAVLFPPLFLAFSLLGDRERDLPLGRSLPAFAALALATVALNWFWLRPMLANFHERGNYWPQPPWVSLDPLRPLRDLFTPSGGMEGWPLSGLWGSLLARDMLIALGAWGAILWIRSRDERGLPWAPLLGTLTFLFWLTYYASFLRPMAVLEPYRYVVALHLFLLPPAATALDSLFARWPAASLGPARRWVAGALAAAAALAPNALPSYASLSLRFPVRVGLEENLPDLARLATWLRAHPEPAGRIMIEDAWVSPLDQAPTPYRNCYALTALVLATGREVTGSRSPTFRGKQRIGNFLAGSAFGRPLAALDDDALGRALDLYNVVWVVAWSERAGASLDTHPAVLSPETKIGPFRIWRALRAKPTFFAAGSGRVERVDFGRIVLSDLEAKDGEVILLYHWTEGLTTDPPAEIAPVTLADDPVPFIRIVSPPRALALSSP